MNLLVAVSLGIIALTGALVAQGAPPATFMVPATREPHHDVKLDNRYVRVLDVTVPPYDSTLIHIHENPYVYVSIGAATLKAQVLGSNEFTDLILKDGEVRYSPVVTHRVGNIGATPFRNITIQIQGKDDTPPTDTSAASAARANGSSAVLDNELIHVERLMLAPGQSTGSHGHARSNLLVAVHDGSVQVTTDGRPPVRVAMKAGDFDWHTGARTHAIVNAGTTPFEAIEVEWK